LLCLDTLLLLRTPRDERIDLGFGAFNAFVVLDEIPV